MRCCARSPRCPAARGLGLLIIDHDMGLIMRLCHRLHVLASGRTIADRHAPTRCAAIRRSSRPISAPRRRMLEVAELEVRYGAIRAVRGHVAVGRHRRAGRADRRQRRRQILDADVHRRRAQGGRRLGAPRRRGHHLGQARRRSCGRGIATVPETRDVFPDLTVDENLTLGGYIRRRDAAGHGRGPRNACWRCSRASPSAARQPAGTLSGRRAADAGHRAGDDVAAEGAAARRAVARPGAGRRRPDLRDDRGAEGGRHDHPAGRAERRQGARRRRPRLCHAARPHRRVGHRRRDRRARPTSQPSISGAER